MVNSVLVKLIEVVLNVREVAKLFYVVIGICLFLARQPQVSQGCLIHEVSRSHTTTHRRR